jgi:putative membrane-bound dehydrogenase-like protein
MSGAVLLAATGYAADPRGDAPEAKLRTPEEERAAFHLPPGFEIQLIAAEPELQKPLNVAFDTRGRVWVTGSTLYPWPARRDALGEVIATFDKNWGDNGLAFRASSTPPEPPENGLDTVRVLSDFDSVTGRAKKVTVFADGLNIPIGVLPLPRAAGAKGDTVLVYSIPAIWRLTDTDGDGKADRREKLYDGFGFKDTHGMSSSYWLWLDGWVYGTHGFANKSEVQTVATGEILTVESGNTYRFRPDGSRFEFVTRGQTNPFGLAFDARGDLYTADSHSKPVYLLVPGGYYEGINKEHDGLGFAPAITTDDHGSSAIAGIAAYSATQFPAEYRGNLFNGNPVTRKINRDRLDWVGSTPVAARQPDFLTSDDPAFRPVQVKLGPDGALWVADFYNPIIGHYEAPLTHPSRDHGHGRLWRIVWRGLEGGAAAPRLQNLAVMRTTELAARLEDPNLMVRSLALNELVARADAASAAPVLRKIATRLVNGIGDNDETAALAVFFGLERLGQLDDALMKQALMRRGSDVAVAALRVLATREKLPDGAEAAFKTLLTAPLPEQAARVSAQIFQQRPQAWQPPLILATLGKVAASDTELTYALRLALKAAMLTADDETLAKWAATDAATAARVADVALAVKTPAAARFLLDYLAETKFAAPRTAEFARHAVQNLPSEDFGAVLPLLRKLEDAPVAQRVTLAEGLSTVVVKGEVAVPESIVSWMRAELLGAVNDKDPALGLRAINALKPLKFPGKWEPLRAVALDAKAKEANRAAALKALTPAEAETEAVVIETLNTAIPGAQTLRRAAAELLGTATPSAAARGALTAAFAGAPADLSLAYATALAKSDDGARDLLELVSAGKARSALLKHRYIAQALEKRPAEVRERAAELTKALPPEDARLDAVVTARVMNLGNLKADRAKGAALFAANCATCHRYQNNGGNLGPSLDGIGSRPLPRLVEDILDPSRNVDPTFRLTTVTLKNGEMKAGMNLRDEGSVVLLRDPATAQEITVTKSEVTETAASPVSPMPAAFETALSEQELADLLDYLRNPAK